MKKINLNPKVESLSTIGGVEHYEFQSNGRDLQGNFYETFTDKREDKPLFLYLFPGSGGNDEWVDESKGCITGLMTYILNEVKKHPGMTIVMLYPFGDNGESDYKKTIDAQNVTDYIKDVVNHFEGEGAWNNPDSYRRRAVAGLCLGALSALKCALFCEKQDNIEKFFSAGIFSPAGNADYGHWLNGEPNFKFIHPEKHRLYLSYGGADGLKDCATQYAEYLEDNDSPVNDFVEITDGGHNWKAFKTAFADYMSKEIFASEYYTDNE